VLRVMRYPEKEMTLIAMLAGMNVGEICGLQWRCVNLTGEWASADGEPIPPRTIAVRNQWHLGELSDLARKSRNRDVPISEALFQILLGLSRREKYTGPDDFVLVSRGGTPINGNNIAARRLKAIGRELQMPWLSWHVIQRTQTMLGNELGTQFYKRVAMSLISAAGVSAAPSV